jgi:hypothetical protein
MYKIVVWCVVCGVWCNLEKGEESRRQKEGFVRNCNSDFGEREGGTFWVLIWSLIRE